MRAGLLALLLGPLSAPAHADLAGICAAAGESSSCVNKPSFGSQVPSYSRPEPVCGPECRAEIKAWEDAVLAGIPDAAETVPLEADPGDETVWQYGELAKNALRTAQRIESAAAILVPAGIAAEELLTVAGNLLLAAWIAELKTNLPAWSPAIIRVKTAECESMLKHKNWACKKVSFSCKDGKAPDCPEAMTRLNAARRCLDARRNVRDVCYGGQDDGKHEEPLENAQTAVDTCLKKVLEKCACPPEVSDKMSATADRLCVGLSDCSPSLSCAENLLRSSATRLCRRALSNFGAVCRDEAARLRGEGLSTAESACMNALASVCGAL